MREFQDRRHMRKLLHSRYVIIVLVVICLFLVRAVWGVYDKYERSKDLSNTAEKDLQELRLRETHLSSLNESLSTEEGQGREIRERFGLVKSGEKTVILMDVESGSNIFDKGGDNGFWKKFLDLFR